MCSTEPGYGAIGLRACYGMRGTEKGGLVAVYEGFGMKVKPGVRRPLGCYACPMRCPVPAQRARTTHMRPLRDVRVWRYCLRVLTYQILRYQASVSTGAEYAGTAGEVLPGSRAVDRLVPDVPPGLSPTPFCYSPKPFCYSHTPFCYSPTPSTLLVFATLLNLTELLFHWYA
eukprot:3086717-Rhodomonas_salina.2